ncbi:MAG: hypothetical protein EA401_11300 [Planctomycetota bacterium]|nr:MAG: hypothetical protein EA401_11300 [Planctomycetota bacterium]
MCYYIQWGHERFVAWIAIMALAITGLAPAGSEEQHDGDLGQRLDRFRTIETVLDLIHREYVQPIDRQQLWNHAIDGIVGGLDRHSHYLSQRDHALFVPGNDINAIGFGFDWRHDPLRNVLVIQRVLPGSSADEQGLVAGDILTAINDTPLLDIPLQLAADRLRNSDDASTLHLHRADGEAYSAEIVRRPLDDEGVTASRIINREHGIGYIRISRFLGDPQPKDQSPDAIARTRTGRAMRDNLDRLRGDGLRALIIDLRGNGGGSLPAAVEVADCFLSGNDQSPTLITRQRGRNPAQSNDWYAKGSTTYPHWPLMILIDGATSSAAEALAAALRDHRRALLVGEPSQGKNSIQQTFHLDDHAALRLTVARFITPHGVSLDEEGLQPDIAAPMSDLQRLELQRQENDSADIDPQLQRAQETLQAVLLFHRQPDD